MKTFAQAAIIFLIVMLTVFICFNLITGNVTDNEVENTLSQSVEQAVYNTMSNRAYSIQNKDEFISDFLTNLALYTQAQADLKVRVLNVDEKEGLLDIEVVETMTYPDGRVREVNCRRTVVFEETVQDVQDV